MLQFIYEEKEDKEESRDVTKEVIVDLMIDPQHMLTKVITAGNRLKEDTWGRKRSFLALQLMGWILARVTRDYCFVIVRYEDLPSVFLKKRYRERVKSQTLLILFNVQIKRKWWNKDMKKSWTKESRWEAISRRNSRDDQRETQSALGIKEKKDQKFHPLNDVWQIKGQQLNCYVYDGFFLLMSCSLTTRKG